MALPRILVVLGSGETSPTMVTPHQKVFARLGADVPAVTLDSPYGFQENADELTERVRAYFSDSVGRSVTAVRFRSRAEADSDPAAHAAEMARLMAARWVFAGPGSPSYALRQWAGSPVPDALDARLAAGGEGGAVVFASAAALTLGLVTVPVYEVYKVGDGTALARRARRPRPRDRAARRGGPALRQHRGRHPRHPVLLPGPASARGARGAAPGRRVRARGRRAHRARARPRQR